MIKKLFTIVALLCATMVSLTAQNNIFPDWYNNKKNHYDAVEITSQSSMAITAIGYIDGVRCDDAYELGIFCKEKDECRSSAPFFTNSSLFNKFGYFTMSQIYGVSGETFYFSLYDHRNRVEVKAEVTPDDIPFANEAILGNFDNFYELAFKNSTTHRNSLIIDDATDLPFTDKQYGITADGIACSYTRNAYLDGGYETIVLPFDADITEVKTLGFVFEKFEGFGENTIKFVELDEGENLKAGVPYIFRYSGTPSKDRKEIVFSGSPRQLNDAIVTNEGWTGTFKRMSGCEIEGHYILNIEGSMMQMASEEAWLDPYHAYLDLPESIDVSTLSVSHRSATTNVDEVLQENVCDEEIMFDLSGKRVKNPSAGDVIIKNNKKIYIR